MSTNPSSELILNDRYRIIKKLAAGGMAYVYLGQDKTLDRTVAIKILKQSLSRNKAFRDLFHQEARAAANLNHPNIVTVYDFGYDGQKLFIIMEYIAGVDLKSYLLRHPELSLLDALELIVHACNGIGHAHKAGIVHCDVKPHNMLVAHDQKLKVTDFGIAQAISASQPDRQLDIVWGSPHYFSPEQAAGFPPTPASDVYSLGIVLYEVLTGMLPFNSPDHHELARMHQEVLPARPRSINPSIPASLDQVILRLLSKDPSSRYSTAEQLSSSLIRIIQENPSLAASYRPPPAEQPGIPNEAYHRIKSNLFNYDWATIGLALLATAAIGGLFPFWFYIWLRINGY